MAQLRQDEIEALEKTVEECRVCEHLMAFHDWGDGGWGARCNICDKSHEGAYQCGRIRDPKLRAEHERDQRRYREKARKEEDAYAQKHKAEMEEHRQKKIEYWNTVIEQRARMLEGHPELIEKAQLTADEEFSALASGLTEKQLRKFKARMMKAIHAGS